MAPELDQLSDEQVIARICDGNVRMYGILITRYERRLFSVVHRIVRNREDVEDALQEGHLHAFTHLGQFNGRSSFLTWVARIMINVALTHLRHQRRFQQIEPCSSRALGTGGARRTNNPEQQFLRAEIQRVMERNLTLLPANYRRVFAMRVLEQAGTAEVAARLGLSEACVRTRLHRARSLLQQNLRAKGLGMRDLPL